ncbi:MAG: DUF4293 family protein [Bacteroidetes bacterium]|nr:DUF4293 family protein [Bacteroidota bacterium]
MIQRIQNLYLGLAFILVSIVLIFNLQYFTDGSVQHDNCDMLISGRIVLILIIILNLGTIFSYKKLITQKFLLKLLLLINILYLVFLIGSVFFAIGKKFRIEPEITLNYFYFIFPIALILLTILALKGVKNDIRILSSADRLR